MLLEWLIVQGTIERGLIFSLCIIALYLTSRIIRFDDLSLEGSFGLGGATMALCLSKGLPWYYALILVIISGSAAGLATGLLHTQLKLNNLISGIVVMTGLFSINLKLAGSNMVISTNSTLFSLLPASMSDMKYIVLLPLAVGVVYTAQWLLTTEYGFLLRAAGDNPQMLINLGKSPARYVTSMLMITNALTALCGAIFVQYLGYFSIWSSVGVLIIALASLILSETMNKNLGLCIIMGSIAYQTIIAATFECNVDPQWNKLITALLIVGMIGLKQLIHLPQGKNHDILH